LDEREDKKFEGFQKAESDIIEDDINKEESSEDE